MTGYGTLRINGDVVPATHFAYDGCHKLYLIESAADMANMLDCGYGQGDIFPVSELARIWQETCWLRFINRADLNGPGPVTQGYDNEPIIEWEP